MHRVFGFLSIFIVILLLSMPIMAACSGEDGTEGGGGGGCGGGQLKEVDKADAYALIDTHAFHTVRGVTILNITQGDGNIALANTNVYFVDDPAEIAASQETSGEVENTEASESTTREYNRIAAHAFHDVKGVTMVQMVAGNYNFVQTNMNVTITSGFMENASDLFYTLPETHE